MENEKTWRIIGDIVEDITRTIAEIRKSGGEIVRDPADYEVFDILARIERKIRVLSRPASRNGD